MRKKTAREQIVEGDRSKRGVHKLDSALRSEPKVESGLRCPDRLKGDARDLFLFFSEQLNLADLDAKPDSPALAVACIALATAWKCDRKLARQGEVREVPILAGIGRKRKILGYRQQKSRWWSVKREAEIIVRAFANQFGLVGPSSRAGMEVKHSASLQDDKELWALLTKPRPKKDLPDPPDVQ